MLLRPSPQLNEIILGVPDRLTVAGDRLHSRRTAMP
jgi:hypothetical protein